VLGLCVFVSEIGVLCVSCRWPKGIGADKAVLAAAAAVCSGAKVARDARDRGGYWAGGGDIGVMGGCAGER